jgi:hypothetical protein
MKMHLGIIGRVLMNMTDNRWAMVIVAGLIVLLSLNYTYYEYRVQVLRGEIAWDIPTANLNPLK